MSGRRQPTDLVVAKGKKHLSKAEEDVRRAQEVQTPKVIGRIRWPEWLPIELRPEFNRLSKALAELGIFCALDRDTLGRYLVAQQNWQKASGYVYLALKKGDSEAAGEWSAIQDRFFKQATRSAGDLGLTITSRCSLVVPQPEPEDDDPFLKFLAGGDDP